MEKNYQGYIFDCDGTLAASMRLHHRAWQATIIKQIGYDWTFPWDFFCSLGGMSTAETIEILEKRYGFKIDLQQLLVDYHAYLAEHLDEVEAVPEVCDFARKCAASGAKMAVASGGFRKEVHEILRNIGVAEIFPVVVTQEDVVNCKPDPEIFLLAAQKMGVPASECLVIEDSPKGAMAAQAAGMDCRLVETK